MTVRELLGRIDSAELAEWMAYWQLEPFGPDVEWLRAGTVAAEVHNGLSAGRGRPARAGDFLPRPPGPEEPQDPQEMARAFGRFAAGHNARIGGR